MVATAVVLVVLFATISMRGRQKHGAKQRDETRRVFDVLASAVGLGSPGVTATRYG